MDCEENKSVTDSDEDLPEGLTPLSYSKEKYFVIPYLCPHKSHYSRVFFSLIAVHCFFDGYLGKQCRVLGKKNSRNSWIV